MKWIKELFGVEKPIIGMIHLKALPGTPRYDESSGMSGILERAQHDFAALVEGGVDAVMFCNEDDRPYELRVGTEIAAAMARVVTECVNGRRIVYGVDVLWDPMAAISIAHATGAAFVREVFTGVYAGDLGLWNTNCGEVLRHKRRIGAKDLKLLYNVVPEFSEALQPRPIELVVRSTVFSSLADVVCVSGPMAGDEVPLAQLTAAKRVLTDTPVFANTGVRHETVREILSVADGAVVGTAFKEGRYTWNPISKENVSTFMEIVREVRSKGARRNAS